MSVRSKHCLAYAVSMLSLSGLQMLLYLKPFRALSDYNLDLAYTLIAQVFCMGVLPLAILLCLKREKGVKENFFYMRYGKPKDLKVCLLASLGLMVLITPFTMVFNSLTTMLLNIIGYKRASASGMIYTGVGDLFYAICFVALIPSIFEEFAHRGVLLSGLEDGGSEMSAVVLSSVCFGLMHTNPLQFLFAVFGGLVFGAAVTKTGSILPAVCAHFANNFVAVLINYSLQKQNAFGVLYETIVGSENLFTFALLVAALAFGVFGVIGILQYLARKTEKPISEKKLFGVLPMDVYKPNGTATLKDNAFLIATMISETFILVAMIVWGVAR